MKTIGYVKVHECFLKIFYDMSKRISLEIMQPLFIWRS